MTRILLAAIAIVFCTASVSEAQFWSTWVSTTGNDANGCALSSNPCRTFAGAYSKTEPGGQIGVLDSGDYGTLTITHSITIDGGGKLAKTITPLAAIPCGVYITISAGSSDRVTIRNLTLQGTVGAFCAVAGIRVTSVGDLHVEQCTFAAFDDRGIDFRATGGYLYLRDVIVRDVGNHAVYVGNAFASIDHLTANNNGTAVLAAGSAAVSIVHSTASGNGTGFAAAYGPTAQLNVENCLLANNQWGIVVSQGATAYVSTSSVVNNYIKGLFNDGASFLISYGTNRFAGNASDGSFTSGMALR